MSYFYGNEEKGTEGCEEGTSKAQGRKEARTCKAQGRKEGSRLVSKKHSRTVLVKILEEFHQRPMRECFYFIAHHS